MRYSNDFYFVTPAELADISEIPEEPCGGRRGRHGGGMEQARWQEHWFFSASIPDTRYYCMVTTPAFWRDTRPIWPLVARRVPLRRSSLALVRVEIDADRPDKSI
jgi:hypothetical protein